MSARPYSIMIDSDIGQLEVELTYEFVGGDAGDFATPSSHASVNIVSVSISPYKLDSVVLEHIEDEILENETTPPED